MAEKGQMNRDDLLAAQIVIDMAAKLWDPELDTQHNDAAFLKITAALKKHTTVTDQKFSMLDKTLLQREFPINTIATPTNTTINVTAAIAKQLQPRDMLMNLSTTERYFVVSSNSVSGDLLVVRDWGTYLGGASASTLATDNLKYMGNAREAGGLSDDSITVNPEESYNYTQFIRTSVEASEHKQNILTYGGSDWDRRRADRLIEHRVKMETTILLGIRNKQLDPVDGAKYIYTTGGLDQHIKGNAFDLSTLGYGSLITERALDHSGEMFSMNGTNDRYVFCGTHFVSGMTNVAKNRLRLNDSLKKKYGMQILEYMCSCGLVLNLVAHPKMYTGYGATSATTGGTLASTAHVVDMRNIEVVGLRNMASTKLYGNIQENDRSGQKDEWRTDIGLRMRPGLDNTYNAAGANVQFQSPHGRYQNFDTYT